MNIFKKEESKNEKGKSLGVFLYGYDSSDNVVEKKEVVSCNDCKCLLYENNAQKIMVEKEFALFTSKITSNNKIYRYYCNTHRRNYEKVSYFFTEEIYFKEMQVDEKGEPIGYKKIKQ